ncbi:MAG: hypothetical protein GVY36_15660 [Verrucomicrobia bacterium]|nr:hypothetical protein [Verrucomicrobiota bacterium]
MAFALCQHVRLSGRQRPARKSAERLLSHRIDHSDITPGGTSGGIRAHRVPSPPSRLPSSHIASDKFRRPQDSTVCKIPHPATQHHRRREQATFAARGVSDALTSASDAENPQGKANNTAGASKLARHVS